jgi:signal transduction histidine kinase
MPEETADRAGRLLEAGLVLASELSLPAVLQRLTELAAEITGARHAALGVLGPDGWLEDFITVGVTDQQRAAIGHPPRGHGILGVLIRDARPLRLADLAADPRAYGFPPNHPPMTSFLGAPVTARGRVFGNLYLTDKQGAAEFDADDERALVILAAQAGVAVENARLYAEARSRERRLDAVREVTQAVLGGTTLDELLELVARHARELAGAATGVVGLPSEDGSAVELRAADGLAAGELRGARLPAEGSLAGRALAADRPLPVTDVHADLRAHPLPAMTGLGPALYLPLRSRGRAFGMLAVLRRRGGRAYGDEDAERLEAFAQQVAVALEYTRAQQELERLAVLEDRERIARELHDGAIQALFAVGMSLQGSALLSGDATVASRIERAVDELDQVIRDLRNYIFGLRPGVLADRRLDQALRRVVGEFEAASGVTAVADVDPAVAAELSGRAADDLVQMTREALSNVARHAQAATCRVSLRREAGRAVLEVDDDGRGFDPAGTALGQGLGNLRGRAARLGGEAAIHSGGEGTTVRVTLPL